MNFLKNLTCPLRSSVEGIVLWGREVVNSEKMIQDAYLVRLFNAIIVL